MEEIADSEADKDPAHHFTWKTAEFNYRHGNYPGFYTSAPDEHRPWAAEVSPHGRYWRSILRVQDGGSYNGQGETPEQALDLAVVAYKDRLGFLLSWFGPLS